MQNVQRIDIGFSVAYTRVAGIVVVVFHLYFCRNEFLPAACADLQAIKMVTSVA